MEQNAAIEKLAGHYSEHFVLARDIAFAGMTVPVVASLRHSGTISYLGFRTGKTGPEACEHVFMLECEHFDDAMLERTATLLIEAEREYIKPDRNHAYTFLSAVVLARDIPKPMEAKLKKYKFRREYGKAGWMLARIAVVDESGAGFCNRDGVDFKKLVLKILEQGE